MKARLPSLALAISLFATRAHADWEYAEDPAVETKAEVDDELTPAEVRRRREGLVTNRLGIAILGGATFSSSREGQGALVSINRPLWYGTRYGGFQWVAEGVVTLGGWSHSGEMLAQGTGAIDFGFNVYCGPVFGLELRHGLAGVAFTGESTGIGIGIRTSFAYTFRLWNDDRKRLKFGGLALLGATVTETKRPRWESDTPFSLGTIGVGLGYETPL